MSIKRFVLFDGVIGIVVDIKVNIGWRHFEPYLLFPKWLRNVKFEPWSGFELPNYDHHKPHPWAIYRNCFEKFHYVVEKLIRQQ